MSIINVRNKITFLFQNYQNGIVSLLPNAFGSKRRYSVQLTTARKRNLLRETDRLGKIVRNLGGGIVKSPLGDSDPIPNQNLVEYVFKDVDEWSDQIAAVSIFSPSC